MRVISAIAVVRSIVLAASAHLVIVGVHGRTAAGAEAITPQEYRALIERQRSQLHSLAVSYKSSVAYDPRIKQRGLLSGMTLSVEETAAFSGSKRYLSSSSNGVSSDNVPIATERVTAFNGQECRRREGKLLAIQADKSAYSELNLYLNCLLWPSTDAELGSCNANPSECHFLPAALSGLDWEVMESRETVRGISCVVMRRTSGMRALWLDPSRGYALVRHVQKDPIPGHLRWVHDYSDFTMVAQGLFLPRHIVVTHDVVDQRKNEPLGELVSTLVVTKIHANDVPDSLFELAPLPAEFIVNYITRKSYQANPNDAGRLERSVSRAIGAHSLRRRQLFKWVLASSVALSIVGVASYIGYSVRNSRHRRF